MKVALTGVAGIGKDEYANYLKHTYGYAKVAFADSLKQIAKEVFPQVTEEHKEALIFNGYSTRDVWLTLGQAIRKIDDNYFIDRTIETIQVLDEFNLNIVVSDVRTFKEFNALKSLGFTVVSIVGEPARPYNKYDDQILEFQSKCDFEFYNEFNGTNRFDEFYRNVLLPKIQKKDIK